MKKSQYTLIIVLIVLTILFITKSEAQGFKKLDKAPHDITYYRESKVTKPLVKVLYGRPTFHGKGEVFGSKVPYNELWRTGANEATEIKIFKDVLIGNKLICAGSYVLYTIPGEKEWEIILNSNTDVLGAFQYNPDFDIAKIKVPVGKAEKMNTFSIDFKKIKNNNIIMVFAWGTTRVRVPMHFNEQEHYAIAFDK